MSKKAALMISAISAVVLASTLFGSTFAATSWAVTDNAATKTMKISTSGTVRSVIFHTTFANSSWDAGSEVNVLDGENLKSTDIPSVSLSGYTFKGWSAVIPDSTHYTASYTSSALQELSIDEDKEYYPILESSADYAYADSNYYSVGVDVEINSNSIGSTSLGRRYVGIDGIPNPSATWNDSRDLYSASGIYKFQNDNGGAMLYRKIGFKPNSNWAASWDGNPGFGIHAWDDSSNSSSIHLGTSGGTTLYGYIPTTYKYFKFSRYSHNATEFTWGNQSDNLSFANDWWWGGSGTNKYTKSTIVLKMNSWSSWIDNWGSDYASWSAS